MKKRYPITTWMFIGFFGLLTYFDHAWAADQLPFLIKIVRSSVVTVITFSPDGTPLGLGSGFFVSKSGDVITNYHVVRGASTIGIRMFDGKTFKVKAITAENRSADIVSLAVDVPNDNVRYLTVSKNSPQVGEKILIIGSPQGLESTVTDGIVSAIRTLPTYGELLQISAPISQGSSGSPVLNLRGEVVGVAMATIEDGQNLNFAIPSKQVLSLCPDLQTISPNLPSEKAGRNSAEHFFLIGKERLKNKNYGSALSYFEKAVKIKPNYPEAWFEIGYCWVEKQNYPSAVIAYERARKLDPEYEEAASNGNLGLAYYKLNLYNDAIKAYKRALLVVADSDWYFNLGKAYEALGMLREEADAYLAALKTNPDHFEANLNLGNVFNQLGLPNDAINYYTKASHLHPSSPDAYFNVGLTLYDHGKYEEAIIWLSKSISLQFEHPKAHYYLGLCHLSMSNINAAMSEYYILSSIDTERAQSLHEAIKQKR